MQNYCGSKTPPPNGRAFASPNTCFRKGLRAGFAAASQKGEVRLQQEKASSKRKETIAKTLGKKEMAEKVKTQGLTALKHSIHLDTLSMASIQDIMRREHEKRAFDTHWSRVRGGKEPLIVMLLQRGYQR